MTNTALGSQNPGGLQVSVSSLTLGTLHEAILAFSSQDSLETFWPSVCLNARWLIPSRRVAILLRTEGGSLEVAGMFEQGKFLKPEDPGDIGEENLLEQAFEKGNAQWFTRPSRQFQGDKDRLTAWLLQDDPELLFLLPIKAKGRNIGAILFVMGSIDKTDQAMLNTLGTIYALHVGMTYKVIQITEERRRMQDTLTMQEKMASLGNLVAGVAHEVNNPVGAVNSAADVSTRCIEIIDRALQESKTVEDITDNARLQQALQLLTENNQVIVTAGARIAKLVESLKNFARLDEAEFKIADLHEGIDSTLTLLDHELKNRVEVVKEYGDLPPIECYPNQLNQVFMNLLVNSIQAIEGKGSIRIRTSSDRDNVYVKVVDTGKGMSAEQIDRIFDPGFTTKGVGVGTGLGLSISYNIVQKHKGEIKVESKMEEGSTFTIVLPRTLSE